MVNIPSLKLLDSWNRLLQDRFPQQYVGATKAEMEQLFWGGVVISRKNESMSLFLCYGKRIFVETKYLIW